MKNKKKLRRYAVEMSVTLWKNKIVMARTEAEAEKKAKDWLSRTPQKIKRKGIEASAYNVD